MITKMGKNLQAVIQPPSWTDESALYQLRFEQSDKRVSAEQYIRMRLNGLTPEESNSMLAKPITGV